MFYSGRATVEGCEEGAGHAPFYNPVMCVAGPMLRFWAFVVRDAT